MTLTSCPPRWKKSFVRTARLWSVIRGFSPFRIQITGFAGWPFCSSGTETVKEKEFNEAGGLRGEVPVGVGVVDMEETVEGSTTPVDIKLLGGADKARTFKVKANNNSFDSERIVAIEGDLVNIKVEAVDKDYDFTIPFLGMRQVIKQGERKELEFQANVVGTFAYYCETCGGLDSKSQGEIIVIPRKGN